MHPANEPVVSAAAVVAAVMAVVTAFDVGTLTTDQTAAVAAVLTIVAAVVARRFTTPWVRRTPELGDQADHANPADFHAGRDVL